MTSPQPPPPGRTAKICHWCSLRLASRLPDEVVAEAHCENGVILSGKFGGSTVAYPGTDRDLGVVLDMFSGTREGLE